LNNAYLHIVQWFHCTPSNDANMVISNSCIDLHVWYTVWGSQSRGNIFFVKLVPSSNCRSNFWKTANSPLVLYSQPYKYAFSQIFQLNDYQKVKTVFECHISLCYNILLIFFVCSFLWLQFNVSCQIPSRKPYLHLKQWASCSNLIYSSVIKLRQNQYDRVHMVEHTWWTHIVYQTVVRLFSARIQHVSVLIWLAYYSLPWYDGYLLEYNTCQNTRNSLIVPTVVTTIGTY